MFRTSDDYYTFKQMTWKNEQQQEEKEIMVLQNIHGDILDVETAKEWLLKAGRFYFENTNAENIVEYMNAHISLSGHFPYNSDKELFQLKEVITTKKYARKDLKRNWGFTCSWCGEKWSTKNNTPYFVSKIDNNLPFALSQMSIGEGMKLFCSEDCGRLFYRDAQKQALHEEGLLKYFDV